MNTQLQAMLEMMGAFISAFALGWVFGYGIKAVRRFIDNV